MSEDHKRQRQLVAQLRAIENFNTGRLAHQAAEEIERLQKYIAAIHEKNAAMNHIYKGLCPDNLQPNSRDPNCPACHILLGSLPKIPMASTGRAR